MCGDCNFPITTAKSGKLESEFGSVGGVEFAGQPGAFFQKVTLHDSEGKQIEIPKCEKCGHHKASVIGKEAFGWMCMGCNLPEPAKLVYKESQRIPEKWIAELGGR